MLIIKEENKATQTFKTKSNYNLKYLELGRVYTSAVFAKAFYESVSCASLKIRNESMII